MTTTTSATKLTQPVPVTFTEVVPFGGKKSLPVNLSCNVVSNLSFQEMCVVARVSPVWNRFIYFHLTDCLIIERTSGMLGVYDAAVEGDGDKIPPPFQDLKDLKRRFAALLNFSKEFRVFRDFQSAMLFARCSRIYEVHGRSWLGIHNIHFKRFMEINIQLRPFAFTRRIALLQEGFTCTASGEPIQGYHFGIEERRSLVLATMLTMHSLLNSILMKQKNTTNQTGLKIDEDQLFDSLEFPFCFLAGETMNQIKSCLSPNVMRTLEAFQNDRLSTLVCKSIQHHIYQDRLTSTKI